MHLNYSGNSENSIILHCTHVAFKLINYLSVKIGIREATMKRLNVPGERPDMVSRHMDTRLLFNNPDT